jgi:ADP-ribosyl-[dinitrogen reductase] hydrolase
MREALRDGLDVLAACDRRYSGAYLLETIPSVLYILACHATDPEEAIVRAVNDTRDNDTVAAIVGAAVCALHGRSGIPIRWISGLAGRLATDDDGHILELIDAIRRKWFPETAAKSGSHPSEGRS